MTTELEMEKSPPLALALRPQHKGRTSEPWPWADGQQREVVEGEESESICLHPQTRKPSS